MTKTVEQAKFGIIQAARKSLGILNIKVISAIKELGGENFLEDSRFTLSAMSRGDVNREFLPTLSFGYLQTARQLDLQKEFYPDTVEIIRKDLEEYKSSFLSLNSAVDEYLQAQREEAQQANPQQTADNNNKVDQGKVDTPTNNTPQPAESWGVRFKYASGSPRNNTFSNIPIGAIETPESLQRLNEPPSKEWFLKLLPAMKSTMGTQGGMDVPGSMPGLSIRITPSIVKHRIPGFQPVYQHMGVDSVVITLVGAFTGADGENHKPYNGEMLYRGKGEYDSRLDNVIKGELCDVVRSFDAYKSFNEFYRIAVLDSNEMEVEINLARNNDVMQPQKSSFASNLRDATSGNPKFKCFLRRMEAFHAKSDRTWYTMELEVTDHGIASNEPVNLTNLIEESVAQVNNNLDTPKVNSASKKCKEEFLSINSSAKEKLDLIRSGKYKISLLETKDYTQSEIASNAKKLNITNHYIMPNGQFYLKSQSGYNRVGALQALTIVPNETVANEVLNTWINNSNVEVTCESTQNQAPTPSKLTQEEAVRLVNTWLNVKQSVFAPPWDLSTASQYTTGRLYREIVGTNGSIDWLKSKGCFYVYSHSGIFKVFSFSDTSTEPTLKVQVSEKRELKGGDCKDSFDGVFNATYYFKQEGGTWKITDYKKE